MEVPIWHSGLANKQTADIKNIQKVAMHIILQENYIQYAFACQTLEERRTKLCYRFATKNLKSETPSSQE